MTGQTSYQLILLKDNECIKTISSHFNYARAKYKYDKMLEDNKAVLFPIQYLNVEKIVEVKYYIALLERRNEKGNESTKLKNEYGQYVDHIIIDNDDWLMIEKEEYNFEETFWVYGYNPHFFRKTFSFIFKELILKYSKNKYEFLNIHFYKNKLIIESFSHTDMVICKNGSDAIRLYCLLDEYCKNFKIKQIMFSGNDARNRISSTRTIDKIEALTHWSRKKIQRNTT